jgi:hypothetical protein
MFEIIPGVAAVFSGSSAAVVASLTSTRSPAISVVSAAHSGTQAKTLSFACAAEAPKTASNAPKHAANTLLMKNPPRCPNAAADRSGPGRAPPPRPPRLLAIPYSSAPSDTRQGTVSLGEYLRCFGKREKLPLRSANPAPIKSMPRPEHYPSNRRVSPTAGPEKYTKYAKGRSSLASRKSIVAGGKIPGGHTTAAKMPHPG